VKVLFCLVSASFEERWRLHLAKELVAEQKAKDAKFSSTRDVFQVIEKMW